MSKEKETRNKVLVAERITEGLSLQQLADRHGVSRQRVAQILHEYGVTNASPILADNLANRVYNYIVKYKIENDGISPGVRDLVIDGKFHTVGRVKRALRHLEARGLIRVDTSHRPHRIQVMGSKWVPPKNWERREWNE